jgi:hypothetical protein
MQLRGFFADGNREAAGGIIHAEVTLARTRARTVIAEPWVRIAEPRAKSAQPGARAAPTQDFSTPEKEQS